MSKDNKIVTYEEIAVSNILEIQALMRILVRKGLITEDEVLKEVKMLKKEMQEKIRRIRRD
jgi:hypothetical protein